MGKSSHVLREDLCTYDPRCTVPSGSIEHAPDVQEGDSTLARGGDVSLLGRGVRHADHNANVEHGEGSSGCSNEEERTTAEAVDEEEEPDEGSGGLDDAVCARGRPRERVSIERWRGRGQPYRFRW